MGKECDRAHPGPEGYYSEPRFQEASSGKSCEKHTGNKRYGKKGNTPLRNSGGCKINEAL
jgi:hypothetical protein